GAPVAPIWLSCHRVAAEHGPAVRRALGMNLENFDLGEALFERVISSRSGLVFTIHEYDDVWSLVKKPGRKVHLAQPSLLEWLGSLDPANEPFDPSYPYILVAGQRRSFNANQILRDLRWRKRDQEGTLQIHPEDLARLGSEDGGF